MPDPTIFRLASCMASSFGRMRQTEDAHIHLGRPEGALLIVNGRRIVFSLRFVATCPFVLAPNATLPISSTPGGGRVFVT